MLEPQGPKHLDDQQQDSRHRQCQRRECKILAQQNVAPPRGTEHEDAKAISVEAKLIGHQLHHAEQRDPIAAMAARRTKCVGRVFRQFGNHRAKTGDKITGVSNIIFASGARSNERKPASAMTETGSDKPGICISSIRRPWLRRSCRFAAAGAVRAAPDVSCPW